MAKLDIDCFWYTRLLIVNNGNVIIKTFFGIGHYKRAKLAIDQQNRNKNFATIG